MHNSYELVYSAVWCPVLTAGLFQYESCGGASATDIICPMYPSPGTVLRPSFAMSSTDRACWVSAYARARHSVAAYVRATACLMHPTLRAYHLSPYGCLSPDAYPISHPSRIVVTLLLRNAFGAPRGKRGGTWRYPICLDPYAMSGTDIRVWRPTECPVLTSAVQIGRKWPVGSADGVR
eukprot:830736-Rhodomonas_salina.4